MFLTPDDFTGEFKVTGNQYTDADFQIYINKYEKKYLIELLGVELYNLFIADLDVNFEPQTAIYQAIYEEIEEDGTVGTGEQYISEGMLEMLKGFIYFNWMRDQYTSNVITGAIKNEYSNSTQARWVETNLGDVYNNSLDSYNTIQWYINENLTDYPTFNGKEKEYLTWF